MTHEKMSSWLQLELLILARRPTFSSGELNECVSAVIDRNSWVIDTLSQPTVDLSANFTTGNRRQVSNVPSVTKGLSD